MRSAGARCDDVAGVPSVPALLRPAADPDFEDEVPDVLLAAITAPSEQIYDGLSLEGLTVEEFADYRGAIFLGPVSLRDVRFHRGFSFEGAKFHGKVRFSGVTNGRTGGSVASFVGAEFRQSVAFIRKTALYRADFQSAQFSDDR